MRGGGARSGVGRGRLILTVKEAAPMGHVCSLHKGLRSPLIPFRSGRTSSGGERMEVGKEEEEEKKRKKKEKPTHTAEPSSLSSPSLSLTAFK